MMNLLFATGTGMPAELTASPMTEGAAGAAGAANAAGGSFLSSPWVMIILFGAIVYFMIIRPQRKRTKEAQDMMSKMEVGSRVVTIGGLIGEVVQVGDNEVTIATGEEKTQMVFLKEAIRQVKTKENKE